MATAYKKFKLDFDTRYFIRSRVRYRGKYSHWLDPPLDHRTMKRGAVPAPQGLTLSFDRLDSKKNSPFRCVVTFNEVALVHGVVDSYVVQLWRWDPDTNSFPDDQPVREIKIQANDEDSNGIVRAIFNDVSPKRWFRARAMAIDRGRKGIWSAFSPPGKASDATPPPAPRNVTIFSNPKTDTVTIEFTPPVDIDDDPLNDIDYYQLQLAKDSSFNNVIHFDRFLTATQATIKLRESLVGNTIYGRVRSSDGGGNKSEWIPATIDGNNSPSATPSAVTISTTGLAAPSNVSLSFSRDESRQGSPWVAVASWKESPPIYEGRDLIKPVRYDLQLQVRRYNDTAISNTRRVTVYAEDDELIGRMEYVFHNITRKREYRFRVAAVDQVGRRGNWSAWTAWSRPPKLSGKVQNLQLRHPRPRLYIAKWEPPADDDGVIGYRVKFYRGNPPGTLVESAITKDLKYEYRAPTGDKDKPHYAEVRALYEGSIEESDDYETTLPLVMVDDAVPATPTNLSISFTRDESKSGNPWALTATWDEVPPLMSAEGETIPIRRYHLSLAIRPYGSSETHQRRVYVYSKNTDSDTTASYIFNNITRKKEYRARVRAESGDGRVGAWSAWTSWQRPPKISGPVQNLTWTHPKPRVYVARWQPPTDADGVIGYRVRVYRGQPPGTLVDTVDTQDLQYRYEAPKADKGKYHYVEVRALYEGSVEESDDPVTAAAVLEGETWPAEDVDLAALGQALASGGHISDGAAPASSPTPVVTPAIGALIVSWAAVNNPDPVVYEVHVSTTSGFTPSPATKVAETAGTYQWVRTLPDGTPLAYGTDYYVRTVARDADGAAAPSAQASGQIAQVNSPDIAAGQVLAEHIAAGSIDAEKLNTVELLAGGLIRAGGSGGRRVELTPDGLTLYDADDTVLVRLPTATSETPYLAGRLVAEALTVLGATLLADTTISRTANLVLERSVTNPGQVPVLAAGFPASAILDFATDRATTNRIGLVYDANGGANGTTPVWWFCESPTGKSVSGALVEVLASTRTVNRTLSLTLVAAVYGVARVGTSVYVLYREHPTVQLKIKKLSAATLNTEAIWTVTAVSDLAVPALGTNGTELLVAHRDVGQQGPGNLLVTRLNASTGAVIATVDTGYAPGGVGSDIYPTGIWTHDDGSGVRWWVSFADQVGGVLDVQSFTTAGARQANEAFPPAAPCYGIAHDGTAFYTLQRGDTTATRKLTKHSNWTWTTESNKYWVGYTWYDSASGAETGLSPIASVTMKRRQYLVVTWPQIPSGANRARVYVERGSTQPATLRRQATSSGSSTTLSSFNASGSANPTTNSFAGSGGGAELRTSDGSPLIRANGIPRARYRRSTAQSIPNANSTIVQFGTSEREQDTEWDDATQQGFLVGGTNQFQAPWTGQYLVTFSAQWVANATGRRRAWCELSTDGGTTFTPIRDRGAADDRLPVSGTPTVQGFTAMLSLSAGHRIRFVVLHNVDGGGSLDLSTANMSMTFLGPS